MVEKHARESHNCAIRPSSSRKFTYHCSLSWLLTVTQAITTYLSTSFLFVQSLRPSLRAILPPLTRASATAAFAMVNVQVLLGISTLLYLVPVPLAAAHQAGSVALLSSMVYLLTTLRRPGVAARAWRQAAAVQKARA